MKGILMVYPEMIVGGAQIYILNKATWLRSRGINAYLITSKGDFFEEVSRAFTETITVDWINELKRYKKYIKQKEKIDEILNRIQSLDISVIESYHVDVSMFMEKVAQKLKLKNIFNPPLDETYRKEFKSFLTFKMNRRELLGLSSKSLSLIKYGYGLKSEYDMHINVPVDKPPTLPEREPEAPGWGEDCFKVLTVARFDKMKYYIVHLIKDLSRVSKNKQVKIALAVVGYGVLADKFKKAARKAEHEFFKVLFLGKTYSPPMELYNACDLYVGMGTTAIEAASLKKPVVLADPVSKRCSGIFGVTNDNSSALLPHEKPTSFYDEIRKLLSDRSLLSHYADRAYDLFQREFYREGVMQKYMGYIQEVLEQQSGEYYYRYDFNIYSIAYRAARDVRDMLLKCRNNFTSLLRSPYEAEDSVS